MTTFPIFRYFFHLSQELLGYKLSCAHVQVPTGYIPKQSLTFECCCLFVCLFFIFEGSGEPVHVFREAKHAHNNPTRKRPMAGSHLASTVFVFFFSFHNVEFAFYLVDATVPSIETSNTLIHLATKPRN